MLPTGILHGTKLFPTHNTASKCSVWCRISWPVPGAQKWFKSTSHTSAHGMERWRTQLPRHSSDKMCDIYINCNDQLRAKDRQAWNQPTGRATGWPAWLDTNQDLREVLPLSISQHFVLNISFWPVECRGPTDIKPSGFAQTNAITQSLWVLLSQTAQEAQRDQQWCRLHLRPIYYMTKLAAVNSSFHWQNGRAMAGLSRKSL